MKPLFHPRLVNDPFGDPALYIDFLFERRALLFDLGDLSVGFDALLRILLGREKTLNLFGPPGFLDQVEHRLASYTWNLVANYESDFVIRATEAHPDGRRVSAELRTRTGFRREDLPSQALADGLLVEEETYQVRTAFLDHGIHCMGFALEEKLHVNVWKGGLEELGLPTGPWLREVKYAALRGEPDTAVVRAG